MNEPDVERPEEQKLRSFLTQLMDAIPLASRLEMRHASLDTLRQTMGPLLEDALRRLHGGNTSTQKETQP